jgi:hypothetical protein
MIPKSFAAFQQLFEDLNPPPDVDYNSQEIERDVIDGDPQGEPGIDDADSARKEKALSFAIDAILADLHDQEGLRDAVVDSLPNLANGTVLLVINPSLDATEELTDFLSGQPRIKRFALGARKLKDGERVRAVKLQVLELDDECDPPDEAHQQSRDQEQGNFKDGAQEEDPNSLRTGFFRGSSSPTVS